MYRARKMATPYVTDETGECAAVRVRRCGTGICRARWGRGRAGGRRGGCAVWAELRPFSLWGRFRSAFSLWGRSPISAWFSPPNALCGVGSPPCVLCGVESPPCVFCGVKSSSYVFYGVASPPTHVLYGVRSTPPFMLSVGSHLPLPPLLQGSNPRILPCPSRAGPFSSPQNGTRCRAAPSRVPGEGQPHWDPPIQRCFLSHREVHRLYAAP